MIRVIWVYCRSRGILSFNPTPGRLRDEPVFGALVNGVGIRAYDDSLVIPRVGPDGFSPPGLILATRLRMFRLRSYRDWLWPNAPPRPRASRRARSPRIAQDGPAAVTGTGRRAPCA